MDLRRLVPWGPKLERARETGDEFQEGAWPCACLRGCCRMRRNSVSRRKDGDVESVRELQGGYGPALG